MKKWGLIVFLALCAGFTFPIAQHYQKTDQNVAIQPPPSTWSGFDEYKRLAMLFKGFAIESMLDIPCADIQELKQHPLGLKHYIGATRSKESAEALQAQFGNELRSFRALDIAIDPLPQVDLIFCWDELCTMPRDKVEAVLLQFKKSSAKYLLIRHYPHVIKNSKNKRGVFKPINWKLAPYHFPEPIIQIIEGKDSTAANLTLWSVDHL